MKKVIISKCMNYIKHKGNYSKDELKRIEYGLVSIYLTVTKMVFILSISLALNIFREVLLFILFFNIIRTVAFGMHATKSWICWISSTLVFVLIPYVCKYIIINKYALILLLLINVLLIFKNAPADTKKRPIVSRKRRKTYKLLATIFSIILSYMAVLTNNTFIQNCILFSLVLENILISPLTYKLFKLPYNNYVDFIKKHPEFTY